MTVLSSATLALCSVADTVRLHAAPSGLREDLAQLRKDVSRLQEDVAELQGQTSGAFKGWDAPRKINAVEGLTLRSAAGGRISQDREGAVRIATDGPGQFAFLTFGPSADFDASGGGVLEIEFALRVDSVAEGYDGAVMLQVFGLPVAGKPARADLIFDDDNVRFFNGTPKANDADTMRTYRLKIQPGLIELFVKGRSEPVVWTTTFGSNLVGDLNELRVGDISGNDSIAGVATIKKIFWRNQL